MDQPNSAETYPHTVGRVDKSDAVIASLRSVGGRDVWFGQSIHPETGGAAGETVGVAIEGVGICTRCCLIIEVASIGETAEGP